MGGLLTSGSKGRAAALGGIAGTMIAGGGKKKAKATAPIASGADSAAVPGGTFG